MHKYGFGPPIADGAVRATRACASQTVQGEVMCSTLAIFAPSHKVTQSHAMKNVAELRSGQVATPSHCTCFLVNSRQWSVVVKILLSIIYFTQVKHLQLLRSSHLLHNSTVHHYDHAGAVQTGQSTICSRAVPQISGCGVV